MIRRTCAHNFPNSFGGIGMAALVGIVCAGVGPVAPARAQMPPDIIPQIAALGRVVDPPNTAKIYTPLQESEPYAGIKVKRDVSYGEHARNVVDIFAAETPAAGRPVLMFVHGGGFVRGSKHDPGSAFYDNVMVFAARNGMVGVNVEYRLAPEFAWPSGLQDLAAAIAFVRDNIASYGGDPNRVFLMGHSAGASHVAGYVSHPGFFGPKGSGLAGAMFSSGSYDLKTEEPGDSQVAYYGADTSRYEERAPLPGLVKSTIPFMISSAELDPPPIAAQFATLKEAMCKSARGCVRSIVLPHHSHMSESYSINTADRQLSDQILEFIRTGK
jgi:pimeloyl-ACP methyl ester carboxylesterase